MNSGLTPTIAGVFSIHSFWPNTPTLRSDKPDYRPYEIPGATRNDLPRFLDFYHEDSIKVIRGVEIGVECGVFSRILIEGCPRLQLCMVDPWEKYPGYRDHVSQDKLEGFREEAQKLTKKYAGRASIIRRYSVAASTLFEDGTLDFVYIDGNHNLQNVIADLAAWTPKLRLGGIMSGHDYRKPKNNIGHHVVEAVNAWTYAYRISPWFLLGAKGDPNRDQNRSWLWVKE